MTGRIAPKLRPSLAETILIVPAAHTRITDVAFQLEMYELFHRSLGSRLGHMLGTPAILLGAMTLMQRAPQSIGLVLAFALVALMALWGGFIDRAVGVATAALGGGLVLASAAMANALGPQATTVALGLVLGGTGVQTFSHMFEPVPPPQSGSGEFVPVGRWVRAVTVRELARSFVLTFGVFYWLELWATPRIWPVQILHLMMRAGYRPELRRRLEDRAAQIVAEPLSDWRRPQLGAAPSGEAPPR